MIVPGVKAMLGSFQAARDVRASCPAFTQTATTVDSVFVMRGTTQKIYGRLARWAQTGALALDAASLTDQPIVFMRNQVTPGHRDGEYSISQCRFRLRHGTGDLWIFNEIFLEQVYSLPATVKAPKRIVDLGGNIGMSVLQHLTCWPDAKIIVFEPDPMNIPRCQWVIDENAIDAELTPAAAATRDGTVRFASGLHGGSHITTDGSGIEVAAVDVFPYLADADLLKIDIEGGEWAILADDRFPTSAPGIVLLEYHPAGCPQSDARAEAERLLIAAGFRTELIMHNGRTGVGMMRAFRDA